MTRLTMSDEERQEWADAWDTAWMDLARALYLDRLVDWLCSWTPKRRTK